MTTTVESHEPQTVVCTGCKQTVVPRVVPDTPPPDPVTASVNLGKIVDHVETPPLHFHAECPLCHHRLYSPALEELNVEEKRAFDWQTLIIAVVAVLALVAFALAMNR